MSESIQSAPNENWIASFQSMNEDSAGEIIQESSHWNQNYSKRYFLFNVHCTIEIYHSDNITK